jgi:predicted membrane protein
MERVMNGTVDTGRSVLTPRLIVGLAIALFGVVLVMDRLNLLMADQVLRWWPAVIVAVGALIFRQTRHVGHGANGIVVMVIGGWLLLNTLGITSIGFWQLFWPLVLIGIGAALVVQAMGRRTREASGGDVDDTLNIFAVLGGAKRQSASTRFRGGEVTAFMGGYQIDLRQATIPPGEEAVLDIFTAMGGGEIIVPASWTVETPIVPLMGGIDDKRIAPLPGAAGAIGGKAAPRLVLRGLVMLGGIEIKS